MLKIKTFFLILAGIFFLSMAAEARVCFLAGGSAENDASLCLTAPKFESESCPGYTTCEVPRTGARECEDGGVKFYLPEDCCSNGNYEHCDSSTGKVCSGTVCSGVNSSGEFYEACQSGYCTCDSSYSEKCLVEDGLIGVGEACNGKYQSCQCNSHYYACDLNATCEGASCNDSRGEVCTSCVCPAADGSEWVSDPDSCCWGYSSTCTNRPSGATVYKCKTSQPRDCVCGYSYSTGKAGCINGCTDSNYEYAGNIPNHVTCTDYTSGITSACGNNCTCDIGYWDFYEQCPLQPVSICSQLGYTDTTCDGNWIGCPYDKTAKKCLTIDTGSTPTPTVCASGYAKSPEECTPVVAGYTWIIGSYDSDGCGKCVMVENTCPAGYAKILGECGRYASGWTLGTLGSNGCGKCSAKPCPTGTSTTCTGALEIEGVNYSGDEICKSCDIGPIEPAECPAEYPYATQEECLAATKAMSCESYGVISCWRAKPLNFDVPCCDNFNVGSGVTVYNCNAPYIGLGVGEELSTCSMTNLDGQLSNILDYGRWSCSSYTCL